MVREMRVPVMRKDHELAASRTRDASLASTKSPTTPPDNAHFTGYDSTFSSLITVSNVGRSFGSGAQHALRVELGIYYT